MAQEQYIDVNGLNIRYFSLGNVDPPLLLIHGTGESAADWFWVMPSLAERQRVIAIDLPGNGYSDKPQSDYSLEFLTQFLTDFLRVLKIDRVILVGNSLGGLISLLYALIYSQQVIALVLVDSAGLGDRVCLPMCSLTLPVYGDLAINWAKNPLGITQRVWSRTALLFANPSQVPQAWIDEQESLTQIPGFLEATLALLRSQITIFGQRQILLTFLPHLQIPTLVIWGINDLVVPYTHGVEAVKRLPQAHLVLIPDCGHLPQIEQPEIFTFEVNKFLSSIRENLTLSTI